MRFAIFLVGFITFFSHFAISGEHSGKSFIELSGDISGTLTSDTPYLVTGDIVVPAGTEVTLEAGTILLFSVFTGLHVRGVIHAKGSSEKPVMFTSVLDSCCSSDLSTSPAPFDWNGIDIYENVTASVFSHSLIKYSVYGIRSQTKHLTIIESRFAHNGKFDFTIEGERKNVESEIPFSYDSPLKAQKVPVITQPNDITLSEKPKIPDIEKENSVSSKKKSGVGKKVLHYTGLLIGVGCGAYSGLTYKTKYKPAHDNLKDLSELDEQEMRTKSSADWNNANEDREKYLMYSVAGAGGALLGLLVFSFSF